MINTTLYVNPVFFLLLYTSDYPVDSYCCTNNLFPLLLLSVIEQTQHHTLIKFVLSFLITINIFVFLVSIRYKTRLNPFQF
jgi:hypothetical protein